LDLLFYLYILLCSINNHFSIIFCLGIYVTTLSKELKYFDMLIKYTNIKYKYTNKTKECIIFEYRITNFTSLNYLLRYNNFDIIAIISRGLIYFVVPKNCFYLSAFANRTSFYMYLAMLSLIYLLLLCRM